MGEIAPKEQFLPLSAIFYYLMLDFYVKTGIRFFLRDKRLFEITEVEITRVDCITSYLRPTIICATVSMILQGVCNFITKNLFMPSHYYGSWSFKVWMPSCYCYGLGLSSLSLGNPTADND